MCIGSPRGVQSPAVLSQDGVNGVNVQHSGGLGEQRVGYSFGLKPRQKLGPQATPQCLSLRLDRASLSQREVASAKTSPGLRGRRPWLRSTAKPQPQPRTNKGARGPISAKSRAQENKPDPVGGPSAQPREARQGTEVMGSPSFVQDGAWGSGISASREGWEWAERHLG